MNELHSTGLENYICCKKKEEPPVFTGRADILNDILTISTRVLEFWNRFSTTKSGIEGNKRIVQSALGADKSSILKKLNDWEITPSKVTGLSTVKTKILPIYISTSSRKEEFKSYFGVYSKFRFINSKLN